jgi:uncharacterized protein with HEPN domain
MSTERLIVDYLDDVLESISDIRAFVTGMSYKEFIGDKKTVNAVIRSLEVIGEAVKKSLWKFAKNVQTFHGKKLPERVTS